MGFINLLAFGYISLISLVVLIYFFSKKKTVIEVPSIIPWSVLKEDVVRNRLFKADLLFLLQILLILLLIFFLARPYFKSSIINISGKNIILIIDTSASMQTTEADGSRFEQAKSRALKMVNKMSQWDKMMVISTDYTSRVICELTKDRNKLKELINELSSKDTGTNLEEGVSLGVSFLKNFERGEMYVLTDQSPSSINFTKRKWKNIKFIRYGENSANVAIASLDVYQDMFKDYVEREAYVTIRNYSDDDKSIVLNVFLDNKPLEKREIALRGGEQKTLSMEGFTTSGILKVEIQTDDFLSVDNTAYAIINEIRPINILLVSDDDRLETELKKIQQSTHRIKITRIKASDYNPGILEDQDAAIFHKLVPDASPDINSLYVFPTKDTGDGNTFANLLVPKQRVVENVRILDWDNKHPIMIHLDSLNGLDIKSSLEFEPPDWSTPLITIAGTLGDSPIAFAGRYASNRITVLGFDLSDFDFSRSSNLQALIMTLNIIQWLNPYEIEGHSKILTGGEYVPVYDVKGNIEILDPEGEIFEYDLKDDMEGDFVFKNIEHIGEYSISGANMEGRFVANLFDETESNIKTVLTDGNDLNFEGKDTVMSTEDKKNEFNKYLLLAVPLILLLEWLLYYKKVRAGAA